MRSAASLSRERMINDAICDEVGVSNLLQLKLLSAYERRDAPSECLVESRAIFLTLFCGFFLKTS